jgi:hypothetical protein
VCLPCCAIVLKTASVALSTDQSIPKTVLCNATLGDSNAIDRLVGEAMNASTHLALLLRPDHEEYILNLLNEMLPGECFTPLNTSEEPLLSRRAESSTLSSQEKCITFALSVPMTSEWIRDIAELVAVGLLFGFVVRGEIDLGKQVINTLGNLVEKDISTSCLQDGQASFEARKLPLRLSECERYLLAVDTGTTEYYNDALRREAFRRDEE